MTSKIVAKSSKACKMLITTNTAERIEVTMSSPLPIHEQTTQSASDSADVVDFLERLKAHEPQPRCLLAGPDKHDHVELPPELFGILA